MPKVIDDSIRDKILDQIKSGKSLHAICADKDMPNEKTVFDWLKSDKEKNIAFSKNYTRAKEIRAEKHFEEILQIADKATPESVQKDRLRIDARKWMLGKMQPKKYGDKVELEHSGNINSKVTKIVLVAPVIDDDASD